MVPCEECSSLFHSRTLGTDDLQLACVAAGNSWLRPTVKVIVDSGATRHMFPDREWFVDVDPRVSGVVELGNKSYKLGISGLGTTRLDCLGRVLWVPQLSMALLSVSQLADDGFDTTLDKTGVSITSRVSGEVVLRGPRRGNLYHIDRDYIEQLMGRGKVSAELPDQEGECALVAEEGTLQRLHRRMGHLSKTKILKALKKVMWAGIPISYDDVKDQELEFCPACLEGKMKAMARVGPSRREVEAGEKFGIDYKGKFLIKSIDGYDGFYLVGDYATDYLSLKLCKSKGADVAVMALEDYMVVLKHNNRTAKIMQCDYDTVLRSQLLADWIRGSELALQMSSPYQHWQNGFIEANMGKIMDLARTLMADGRVPARFWAYAVQTAVWLSNRTPVAKLKDVTPHEAMAGEKPDMTTTVPFWSTGVYRRSPEERRLEKENGKALGPWAYKGRQVRMVGYSEHVKGGYRVYDLTSKSVKIRNDVEWDPMAPEDEEEADQQLTEDSTTSDLAALEEDIARGADESDEESTTSETSEAGEEPMALDEDSYYWGSGALASDLRAWLGDHHARALAVADELEGGIVQPASLAEALAGPEGSHWRKALNTEKENFQVRGVFVPAEQTGHAMDCKVILKKSLKPDGTFKYKVRLVAKGFTQIKHVNYNETYAPTTSTTVVLVLMQLAAMGGFHMSSFDVTAAFLEGENDYPNYAWIPAEFGGEFGGMRVRVKGNFYGEKQAPKIWNDKLNDILVKGGCVRCPAHPCLYKYTRGKDFLVCSVHVDDGLVVTNSTALRRWLEGVLKEALRQVTFEPVVKKYIGIDVNYDQAGRVVSLTHKSYITDNWSTFTSGAGIPMCPSHNLRTAEKVVRELTMLHDTGKFRFACDRARPDILVVTGEIATGGDKNPSLLHEKVSCQAKNYLNATRELGLVLRGGGDSELDVFGYCDAAYITQGNCKSRLGGCIFLNSVSGAIRSFSKTDTQVSSISHSSTEAEIKAVDEWVREVMHIMDLLEFLCGKPYGRAIPLFVDNKSAIELCTTLKQNHKVKHINLRINFIREMVMRGFVTLHFIGTADNTADVLTKALGGEVFTKHRDVLLSGHGGAVRRRLEEHAQLVVTADNIDA